MSQLLDLAHTAPPEALLMPAMPQLVTTVAYGIGALAFIAYAIVLAHRERSALPLLFILGALLTIFLEPVVDLLGNAVHPQVGQYHLLTTNGHPVPWAVLVGYVWYFAAAPLLGWRLMRERTLTQVMVWKAFATVAVTAAIVEQIPLHFGVWHYYGEQALKIGYMPVWWIVANTTAVMLPFLLIYKLFPSLTGPRQWLVIGIIPSGAFMGHAAAGWPMYNVLGTQTDVVSPMLLVGASVASIALALVTVWVVMAAIELPQGARSNAAAQGAASRKLHAH